MTFASYTPRGISRIREKITELPLYHSGVLFMKHPAEKDFKKYYAELRGCTIFLYTDNKEDTCTERLELRDLKAMQKVASEFGSSVYSLILPKEEVHLKASSPDAEEWRGYIAAATSMEIPNDLGLLPGQMMRLEEVSKEERRRTSLPLKEGDSLGAPCRTNSHITADLPSCFYNVTRQEAVQMLEADPEWGNLILRPSADCGGYAVSTRRIISGDAVIKHYKIQPSSSGFVIQLQASVTAPSLNEVVLHFVKQTGLQPFVKPQHNDTRIKVCGTKPDVTAESVRLQKWSVPPGAASWQNTPPARSGRAPRMNLHGVTDSEANT
ncbi:signal-transducing adaptor protein 1-like [Brienomyrus brachyistius]|uniref:signal-transducing adaptor protein 1-like n=1 Tax=Brienomyrus brachyistius TaxID=42636 RepID=UPI0020B2A660|nr:signal-transducing adaptor protein 1-like [Brienomyrus brachyistius]